jgi:hypothetical protein
MIGADRNSPRHTVLTCHGSGTFERDMPRPGQIGRKGSNQRLLIDPQCRTGGRRSDILLSYQLPVGQVGHFSL